MTYPKGYVSLGFRAAQCFAAGLDTGQIAKALSTPREKVSEAKVYNLMSKCKERLYPHGSIVRPLIIDETATYTSDDQGDTHVP